MNIGRLFSRSCTLAVVISGCAEPATYADENLFAIQYDCQQTAPCDPMFGQRADGVSKCVADTSAKLNGSSENYRATYMKRYERCAVTSGCAYFECARDPMLYSIVHDPQIVNECQQSATCKAQRGQPLLPDESQLCVNGLAQRLDFGPLPDRQLWEQRATRCTGMVGCAYIDCTP